MPKELPSDDEIRAKLRQSRPRMAFEALGCVAVLACAGAGALAGIVGLDALFGPPAGVGKLPAVRAYIYVPAAGALVGLAVGVLAFHLVRKMTHRPARHVEPDRHVPLSRQDQTDQPHTS